MPNTMPDMVSRPAVVKKSLLGCEWSRKVQKLKTTKFQNQAVPKPGGAARGGVIAILRRSLDRLLCNYTIPVFSVIQRVEIGIYGIGN